ncbi:MAG: cobalt ECF transporter T component CbiQ [Methanobacteriaceae archaeon]
MSFATNTAYKIEKEAMKDSVLHRLDGRIKLIIALAIIIFAVSTENTTTLLFIEIYLLILVLISRISIGYFFKRILLILPFGGFMAVLQPFFIPGTVLYTLPLGITITEQGIIFGFLLISRLFVCLTSIVLLSSISPMENIVNSMRKLGFPKEMAMIMNMTIRYLFVFFDVLANLRKSQKSRGFDIWNKETAYLWRLKQIGYSVAMIFLKAFEQGERVYLSMLSRSYSGEATEYQKIEQIKTNDYILLTLTISILLILQINYFFKIF